MVAPLLPPPVPSQVSPQVSPLRARLMQVRAAAARLAARDDVVVDRYAMTLAAHPLARRALALRGAPASLVALTHDCETCDFVWSLRDAPALGGALVWGPLSALRRRRVAPGVRAWVSLDPQPAGPSLAYAVTPEGDLRVLTRGLDGAPWAEFDSVSKFFEAALDARFADGFCDDPARVEAVHGALGVASGRRDTAALELLAVRGVTLDEARRMAIVSSVGRRHFSDLASAWRLKARRRYDADGCLDLLAALGQGLGSWTDDALAAMTRARQYELDLVRMGDPDVDGPAGRRRGFDTLLLGPAMPTQWAEVTLRLTRLQPWPVRSKVRGHHIVARMLADAPGAGVRAMLGDDATDDLYGAPYRRWLEDRAVRCLTTPGVATLEQAEEAGLAVSVLVNAGLIGALRVGDRWRTATPLG